MTDMSLLETLLAGLAFGAGFSIAAVVIYILVAYIADL